MKTEYLQKLVESEQKRISGMDEEDVIEESRHCAHINDIIQYIQRKEESKLIAPRKTVDTAS